MKKLFICLMAIMIVVPTVSAQKKAKEKKEKKPYEWKMPDKLSGNADIDDYLNTCDATYKSLIAAKEAVAIFRIDTTYTKGAAGEQYMVLAIKDQDGNLKNFSSTLMQSLDILMSTTNIALDMTNITLGTATATLALTSNPLLAFSHGKYIKDGPKLVAFGGSQLGGIVTSLKSQINDMKTIKKNAVDLGDIKSTDQVIINKVAGEVVIDESDLVDLDSIDMGSDDGAVEIDEDKLNQANSVS